MVELHWSDVEGKELRYADHTWELTGDVALLDDGDVLAVEARQANDVQGDSAKLYFDAADPPDSLNPGRPEDLVHSLAWEDGDRHLVVRTDGPTYEYELRRLEYE